MKDLKHLIYFENLLQQADNELVEQGKKDGKLALGYTCYFVPETLLNLPGCFSTRLRAPNSNSIDIGTYYMTNKICSYTRSILERGIEGGFDYLDALLSSETCQMMHRGHEHFEILGLVKEKNPKFFMSMMDVPFSDSDNAVEHYEDQIRTKLLEPLRDAYGVDISDGAIRKAIDDHNEISAVISEIGAMRKLPNPPITGYEFHVLELVSEVCPHYLVIDKLRETLDELKKRKPDKEPWFRARVVLTGSEIDDPGFTKLLEDCGAMVVADRYCYGSLPGREQIEIQDGETALHAAARHYLRTSQCPRFMDRDRSEGRRKYIKELTDEYGADGVIYTQMKFCEFWSYERVLGVHVLAEEMGVPTMGIEREYTVSSAGQLRTRFQAFIESLEIKNIQGGKK
jgi:benzoyl-CoA reductase/2-hydroxyglutaryl-CoA dehydratase subunit BcrC/BadD/HgdB